MSDEHDLTIVTIYEDADEVIRVDHDGVRLSHALGLLELAIEQLRTLFDVEDGD